MSVVSEHIYSVMEGGVKSGRAAGECHRADAMTLMERDFVGIVNEGGCVGTNELRGDMECQALNICYFDTSSCINWF